MRNKNSGTIMDRMLGARRILERLLSMPAALLLGGSILLSGPQLTAQDWLLKEYIYLDGRLLAVESNVVMLAAQQPEIELSLEGNAAFALHTTSGTLEPVRTGNNWRIEARDFRGSSSTGLFQGTNLAASSNPGAGLRQFHAGEEPESLRETSRRAWNVRGNHELREGGNYGHR